MEHVYIGEQRCSHSLEHFNNKDGEMKINELKSQVKMLGGKKKTGNPVKI